MVPLLARVYPNGNADVNHFQAAGGMAFVIGQLLDGGLLHGDVRTVAAPVWAATGRSHSWGRTVHWFGDPDRPKASTGRCCARSATPSPPTAGCASCGATSAAR